MAKVEISLQEAKEIREAIESIANIQQKSVLLSFGTAVESDESEEDEGSETDPDDTEESTNKSTNKSNDNSHDKSINNSDNSNDNDSQVHQLSHQFFLTKELSDTGSEIQNSHELIESLPIKLVSVY